MNSKLAHLLSFSSLFRAAWSEPIAFSSRPLRDP